MSMWKDTTTLSSDKFRWNSISLFYLLCVCRHVNEYRIANWMWTLCCLPPHTIIPTSVCPFEQSSEFNIEWEIWTHVQATEKSSCFLWCVVLLLIFFFIFFDYIHFLFSVCYSHIHIPRSHNINYQSSAIVFITNDVSVRAMWASPHKTKRRLWQPSLFSSHGRWVRSLSHSILVGSFMCVNAFLQASSWLINIKYTSSFSSFAPHRQITDGGLIETKLEIHESETINFLALPTCTYLFLLF